MNGWFGRVGAIFTADLRARLRKKSSFVVLVAVCLTAYGWVPAPTAGYALMAVEGHRVLLDSPAMALATGLIFSLLMALVGFFLVKGSIETDLASRCGLLVAATPTKSLEYLAGRFLGNTVFLAILGAGFLLSSMAMQWVRGEAPLDPQPYLVLYLLFLPPAIVFPAVMALVFDASRWLSGRGGEVLYFFLWGLLVAAGVGWRVGEASPGAFIDVTGAGMLETAIRELTDKTEISIGAATYDRSKEILVFEPVAPGMDQVLPRLVSTLVPLPLLALAAWLFHRFDPSRARSARERRRGGRLAGFTGWAGETLTALLSRLPVGGRAATEAALTLRARPAPAVGLLLSVPVSLLAPTGVLVGVLLPAILLLLAVVLADGSCRERREGSESLVFAAPRLREGYVPWKATAGLLLTLAFTGLPALRLFRTSPGAALSVLIGGLLVASAATALGVLTGTPRAFLFLFLCFWYVVLNDGGATPGLDFGGFFGGAPPGAKGFYLGLSAALLALAGVFHRVRLARS